MEPLLYELHDLARSRGVEGYRRMSKSELLEVVGEAPAGGSTTVERSALRGLALLTLRGGWRSRRSRSWRRPSRHSPPTRTCG